jgi:hypothetical protein
MAITRQSNLFASEDWKKVYQSFRDIDFQSYDFETIRKSMVDYLRTYYPEDFNDFIESSEYIALVDLIAFLAQSTNFRTDLNARENFLETAERRDSVLKLARMLSYFPKRSQISRGILKITSVATTESVLDSNNVNLRNTPVFWGDTANPDFLEQYTTILNAAFVSTQKFGNPSNSKTVAGIKNEEYQLNLTPNTIPVYGFTSTVSNRSLDFELVNGTYSGEDFLYEQAPKPGNTFNLIYKNDGRGFNSINSGFFMYFKQGVLQSVDFNVDESLPNRVVEVDVNDIDNNDVWLYSINSAGDEDVKWTKVPAVTGTNVIYNSLSETTRTLYSVNSRANDQISLVFGDGVFTQIPVGNYRAYFRTGVGQTYKILPEEMNDVEISIPYISHANQLETLTISLSLQTTINNATARENLADIKTKAQQQYYTQNRMVTGEDYQIMPFTSFSDVLKSKAVNRTASGVSRYLDVRDTTGKYSSTNIFAEDGIFYREEVLKSFNFTFVTSSDISNTISTSIEPVILNNETKHFYYKNFTRINTSALNYSWNQTTKSTGTTTGYFKGSDGGVQQVGGFTSSNMKYVKVGALVKFTAPSGKVFDVNNNLITGTSGTVNTKDYIWAGVSAVVDDGTNQGLGNLSSGLGPITLSEVIPSDAVISEVIAPWNTTLSSSVKSSMITNISEFRTFGLRYDVETQEWAIITGSNLNTAETFSTINTGSVAGTGLDNSWIFLFTNDGATYTVKYRRTSYIFESVLETRFYFDNDLKVFDPRTGRTIKDKVNILKVNSKPDDNVNLGVDYPLNIDDRIVETDGYTVSERIKVTFSDTDSDSTVDDPDVFDIIVAPDTNSATKVVYYQTSTDSNGYAIYTPIANSSVESLYPTLAQINEVLTTYSNGQIFYASTPKKFYKLTVSASNVRTVAEDTSYFTKTGRSDILFQYTHNSPNNRRIDPAPTNIVDLFLLTNGYNTDFRNYIQDITGRITKPVPPTTTELRDSYGSLEDTKSVSDSIIFNSVKYRPLFGSKADEELQAQFKVVKNPSSLVSDSEIKERIITAINNYFAVENWDFGDTFYFNEMSSYLVSALSPDLLSIVIVPKSSSSAFGSLFEIQGQRDEIFINSATVNDISVIDKITAVQLTATGTVVNASTSNIATESVSAGTTSSTSINTSSNTTTTSTSSSSSSSSSSSGSSGGGSGGYGY